MTRRAKVELFEGCCGYLQSTPLSTASDSWKAGLADAAVGQHNVQVFTRGISSHRVV